MSDTTFEKSGMIPFSELSKQEKIRFHLLNFFKFIFYIIYLQLFFLLGIVALWIGLYYGGLEGFLVCYGATICVIHIGFIIYYILSQGFIKNFFKNILISLIISVLCIFPPILIIVTILGIIKIGKDFIKIIKLIPTVIKSIFFYLFIILLSLICSASFGLYFLKDIQFLNEYADFLKFIIETFNLAIAYKDIVFYTMIIPFGFYLLISLGMAKHYSFHYKLKDGFFRLSIFIIIMPFFMLLVGLLIISIMQMANTLSNAFASPTEIQTARVYKGKRLVSRWINSYYKSDGTFVSSHLSHFWENL